MKMSDWKIVDRDGNPKEPGSYLVVLIYPEYNTQPTGRTMATIDIRYLSGPCDNDNEGWAMTDEDATKNFWTEQVGSYYKEKVYAWREIPKYPMCELPEGVIPELSEFTEGG